MMQLLKLSNRKNGYRIPLLRIANLSKHNEQTCCYQQVWACIQCISKAQDLAVVMAGPSRLSTCFLHFSTSRMNSRSPLLYATLIGFFAGIGHGFVSHNTDLPLSLTDQFIQPFQVSQIPEE